MNRILTIVCAGVLVGCFSFNAFAGEVDLLLEKLVDKGVLSQSEAQVIRVETKEQVRKEVAQGKSESLPQWVQNMKWKGDFRLRYENTEESAKQDRTRGRYRLRFGFKTKVNDQTGLVVRMASGTGEQTSTNQSFTGGAQNKDLDIDQAYITYTPQVPLAGLVLMGGKMENPYYHHKIMWDGDVNPEGVGFGLSLPLAGGHQAFVNGGSFILYESSSSSDEPTIHGIQTGLSGKLFDRSYKFAAGYTDFHNLQGSTISAIFPGKQYDTNSGGDSDIYTYDFNIVSLLAEYSPLELKVFGQSLPVKVLAGLYNNTAKDVKKDSAWHAGMSLGKAKEVGTWEAGFDYRKIENDAFVAELSDSDFHGGGTNSKGYVTSAKYQFSKNAALGVTYFDTEIDNGSKKDVDTLQVDYEVKF